MSAQSTMLTEVVSRFRLREAAGDMPYAPNAAYGKNSSSAVGFSL
jgi:hypothetical protein